MSVMYCVVVVPHTARYRQQNVRGLILVGPTLSGSGAAAWQTKLSGVLDPYPAWNNMIPGFKLASLPTFPLETAVHQMTLGMPSFALVLPGDQPLGKDHVLVETPSRSYTVGQQKELLMDMGDEQGVSERCCACAGIVGVFAGSCRLRRLQIQLLSVRVWLKRVCDCLCLQFTVPPPSPAGQPV